MSIGARSKASSFSTPAGIPSGPSALCGSSCDKILYTPGLVIHMFCIVGCVESGRNGKECKSSIVKTDLNALLSVSALLMADMTVPSGVSMALIPMYYCLRDLMM